MTLHEIDEGADTGPIIAQKAVAVRPTDTAKSLYDRLQVEIVALFKETWPKVVAGETDPFQQNEEEANYQKKRAVKKLDPIHLDRTYTGQELIDRLRARSFGDKGFAYFEVAGERVYLNLRLGPSPDFGD